MTKLRWAAMGIMFLGAYVLQAFGCSSSPAPAGGSGGACCACTVTEATCSKSTTYKPLIAVNDCTSFCAGQSLGTCSGSAAATPTITAAGVSCPDGGVTPIGYDHRRGRFVPPW